MFYIIFFAVIAFALYVILHDNHEGEPKSRKQTGRPAYRPEQQGSVPLTPVSPTPKPLEPAPRTVIPEPARPAPKPGKPTTVPLNPEPRIAKPAAARPAKTTYVIPTTQKKTLSWSYLYSLDYDDSLVADVLETEIAGMRYHCSVADLGLVNGYIEPEPSNPHDPHAQAVFRADGKKLGYIPKNVLPEYEDFNPGHLVCPFAGEVKVTRQGYMWADILVALPMSRDFVKETLSAYVDGGQQPNLVN